MMLVLMQVLVMIVTGESIDISAMPVSRQQVADNMDIRRRLAETHSQKQEKMKEVAAVHTQSIAVKLLTRTGIIVAIQCSHEFLKALTRQAYCN